MEAKRLIELLGDAIDGADVEELWAVVGSVRTDEQGLVVRAQDGTEFRITVMKRS